MVTDDAVDDVVAQVGDAGRRYGGTYTIVESGQVPAGWGQIWGALPLKYRTNWG